MLNLGNANVTVLRDVDGVEAGDYYFEGVTIDNYGRLTVSDGEDVVILEPTDWKIEDRYSPYDSENEVQIKLAGSGISVVVETSESNPEGTSYVRFVCNDHEVLYWNSDEWEESGQEVMGAIFGYMFSVLGNRELAL